MLSTAAFNALLKTLEEPPSHVKFIFATTDIRKVPVTVLSRCQRFDLRRVEVDTLKTHFQNIAGKENVTIEEDALTMIARAADGSVRDGLSLLDQAIALGTEGGVTGELVSSMLGATDRVRILDLLQAGLSGKPSETLDIMHDLYRMGADPQIIIQDMMDMTHALSMLCVDKAASTDALPHASIDKAKDMAGKLTVPQLQKTWQILLKGLGEMHSAPNPQKAAEMIILRLVYAAELPDPSDLLRRLKNAPQTDNAQTGAPVPNGHGGGDQPRLRAVAGGGATMQAYAAPEPVQQTSISTSPTTMQDMVALFEARGEFLLAAHLYQDIACVKLEKGRLEFVARDTAPTELAGRIRGLLSDWTGENWMVSLASRADNALTLAEIAKQKQEEALNVIKSHADVKAVLDTFPGAEISRIYNPEDEEA